MAEIIQASEFPVLDTARPQDKLSFRRDGKGLWLFIERQEIGWPHNNVLSCNLDPGAARRLAEVLLDFAEGR